MLPIRVGPTTTATPEAAALLTPLQLQVVQLRDVHGMTYREIAEHLGKNVGNVHRIYKAARVKMVEHKSLVGRVKGVAPPINSEKAVERLRREYQEARADRQGEKLTDKQLSEEIDGVIDRALFLLTNDENRLARSSAKDLTTIVDRLIDKRQLLRGEPTQVVKIQDVRKLDEMAKMLHEEMERRGLLVDVTPEKEKVASESP